MEEGSTGLWSDQTAYLGADGVMQAKRQSVAEKQRTLVYDRLHQNSGMT
jgi:hypothetical protein